MTPRDSAAQRQQVELRSAILDLLAYRAADSSICPSEAARRCDSDDWRELMDPVRDVAAELAAAGIIEVTQGGSVVDVTQAHGPVRLRRGPRWGDG